jgi:hypothetical protein
VNGFASESIHSAQDDKTNGKDLDVFRAFAKAGQRLAEIHVNYEQQPEYNLTKAEKKGEKPDYGVTKMKLSKGQNHAHLQPIPNPERHSKRNLRLSPRQSLGPGMDHRSISGLNRQTQRHHQRSQPAPTIRDTFSASSAKSSPSAWSPSKLFGPCRHSACPHKLRAPKRNSQPSL